MAYNLRILPMQKWNGFPRVILLLVTLIVLLTGLSAPTMVSESVSAAPMMASALDVIISEVAWGGTAANSSHEWIELYNTTSSAIDISSWTLISSDGTPSITISPGKIIPANGYYLLESSLDAPISDITADQTYTGTLGNTSEILTLRQGATTIDTANSGCSGCWYAGSGSPDYYSMERIGFLADDVASWASNNGVTRNGLASDGITPINGTPHNSKIDLALSIKMKDIVGNTPPFTATFTITVRNMGYGTATNVSVKDDLPVGLTFVSYVSSVGAYNEASDTWTVGSLPTGASETLDITVSVTGSGIITNMAEVWTSDQLDPDSAVGNSSTTEDDDDSIKVGLPILDITNTVSDPTPNIGTNVAFTISVSNPNTAATGVEVDALLPVGLNYISHSATPGTIYNSSSGIWTIGNLTTGASATLIVTATVMSNGLKTYVADVSSNEFANSSASSSVNPVGGESDLRLVHEPVVISTSTADQVVLPIKVYNDGPYDATAVDVKDILPSGLTFVSYTSTSGTTYSSSTGIWTIDGISNGASAFLNITVKVSSSGTSTNNFAEVWVSDQFDPDSTPGNGDNGEDDNDSVEVPIVDLSLTETVDIAPSSAIFTIKVTNSGPDGASGVKVKTSLPTLTSTYTFVSDGETQGSYNNGTGIWDVGALADGVTATLTITTTTSGSLSVNWVEVSASDQVDIDSVPNNGSKTEDDDASAPSADLFLTQSVNNVNPDLNTNVIFTVTLNNLGAGETTNVQVKDVLPTGLTYVSYTSTSGTSYSSSTGIWTIGTVLSGESKVLNITAKVTTVGMKTNWAEVWKSDVTDPDSTPGNSSTTEDDDASATITSYRSILINEVAWAGTGSTSALQNDQWLELYNPSSASINITGWTLTSASINITLSGTISAGGFFLLERGDNLTVSDITADQIYTGILLVSGEVLTLRDNSGSFIDTANGNGGGWPAGSSSTFGSMERISGTTESDSSWVTNTGVKKNGKNEIGGNILGTPRNGNSTGSSSSTPVATVTPIPTSTPIPAAVVIDPRPIINEILPRPGFDWNQDGRVDVFDEFIEIKNLTAIDINLSGWVLDDEEDTGSEPYIIPSVILKPGQRVVFYGLETNILLSDGGDTVRLIHPTNGKIYDAYTYSIAKYEDLSICRLPDGNVFGGWYDDCIPTPNLTNTREGVAPSMPGGGYESSVCELPDTLPEEFLLAECHGYGANIWNAFYWDESGWLGTRIIPQNLSKWETFIK